LAIAEAIERRRAAVARAWRLTDEVVLIGAGAPIGVPGHHDLCYPFHAHAEYLYLTDRNRAGGVLTFDPGVGWVEFLAPVTQAERLWTGASPLPEGTATTDALEQWLSARAGRPTAWLGTPAPGASSDAAKLGAELRFALSAVRRRKDAVELARMRAAARFTVAAHAAAVPLLRPGVSEREVQIELEAAAYRAGADAMGYDTIVGGGANSAVLHFPPGDRRFRAGELVLIDAGAAYRGYVSDITRTHAVGGAMTPLQAELHGLVGAAQRDAIAACAPGVEWREIHRSAALTIAGGLAAAGVLRGAPDTLVQSGAVALFFPHGIGHLVGLGVRDAGGILADRRDDPPPFPNLRIDLPLEPGMVVTVEPGVYFVPALLNDPDTRRRHRQAVDWGRVDALLGFGGIRIEDNVLITPNGHELLNGPERDA
jgi:Xaa-Pro aminopeptidase